MNTFIDILTVMPFLILFVPAFRPFFWIAVAGALLVVEFFSTLPFGFLALAFGLGFAAMRVLLTIFDSSSFASFCIVFLAGILIQAGLVTGMHAIGEGSISWALLVRGGIFGVHQLLSGAFLLALVAGFHAAVTIGSYAVVEEKNPFA